METATRSGASVIFAEFELNLHTRELYRNGTKLKISGHPIEVLAILLEHPGELVTRETLQKRLWSNNTFVDSEQILNNSVGKLRVALGDRAETPNFIETLPRLGYRFIAPVDKSETDSQVVQAPMTAEPPPPATIPAVALEPRRLSKHWVVWPLIAITLGATGYWYAHLPLPAPHVTHYEQLTLDGRRKIPRGTDGRRVFMNLAEPGRGGILQVPVSGGKVTDFSIDLPGATDLDRPNIANVSPDGSSLLVMNQFVSGKGFMSWVVGNLGHPVRYLGRLGAAGWSPDGRTIANASPHGDIYRISVDGGETRLLHREDGPASQLARTSYMAWSPDGTTLRFTRLAGKIFEISSTGANLHEWLPGWNGGIQKCCGRWTPDGQFYLFIAERTLAKDPTFRPLAQIWAVDERHQKIRPRIAKPILLASGPLLWGNPIPSLDGKKIFARGVSLRAELERYDPAAKHLIPYLGDMSADMPAFSRDGKYVAYVSFPDGILWRANRDGSGPVQLTQPPFYPRNPRWSPDGTQLLFTDNTKGVDAIYVVSSQGGTPKRLIPGDDGPQSLADWSPDGLKSVYATERSFSLMPGDLDSRKVETRIVELATGRVTVLPARPEGFWAPLWSPDGRYIAGRSFESHDVTIFDLETGKWRVFPQKGRVDFHNWSHDGRFIYFVCLIKGKIGVYRVSVSSGKSELVLDIPEGFRGTGWYDFWMSLDPDDAPLILRDAGTDEIYALTLARE